MLLCASVCECAWFVVGGCGSESMCLAVSVCVCVAVSVFGCECVRL